MFDRGFDHGGCTRPGGNPPSSEGAVAPTAEGLARFFEEHCIESRDLPWILDEVQRRRWWSCAGADEGDDCMADVATYISWNATTTSGDRIRIQVSVLNPVIVPQGRVASCQIKVSETLGHAIQGAIPRLRIGGLPLRGPFRNDVRYSTSIDLDLTWRPASAQKPEVELQHVASRKQWIIYYMPR